MWRETFNGNDIVINMETVKDKSHQKKALLINGAVTQIRDTRIVALLQILKATLHTWRGKNFIDTIKNDFIGILKPSAEYVNMWVLNKIREETSKRVSKRIFLNYSCAKISHI